MLDKRIDGWRSLIGLPLLPLGVLLFLALVGVLTLLPPAALALGVFSLLVFMLWRDARLARRITGRSLDAFAGAAVCTGAGAVMAGLSLGSAHHFGSVYVLMALVNATLVLLVVAALRARWSGRTRCLGRSASGCLAAIAVAALAVTGTPEFVLAGAVVWLAVEALGERVYRRLPKGPIRHQREGT